MGGTSQLCYLVGIALGGALCLRLLPRAGPRRLLLCALACEAVLALLLAVVQVFWAHALVRFLLAIASAHLFTAAATLCESPRLLGTGDRAMQVTLFAFLQALTCVPASPGCSPSRSSKCGGHSASSPSPPSDPTC